jgi:hypothetical protein
MFDAQQWYYELSLVGLICRSYVRAERIEELGPQERRGDSKRLTKDGRREGYHRRH